jgi:hypothetical protein
MIGYTAFDAVYLLLPGFGIIIAGKILSALCCLYYSSIVNTDKRYYIYCCFIMNLAAFRGIKNSVYVLKLALKDFETTLKLECPEAVFKD